jgi:endonuclease/exonuclease/phosphatase family metal-dependent hydrolase
MTSKTRLLFFIVFQFFFVCIASGQEISVLTYNIRFDNPNDGENRWDARKDRLVQLLRTYSPDIFGIQEGLVHQVYYIDSSLTDYDFIGRGRDDGKEAGEYCALYYKKSLFNLLDQGIFWLSEIPEVPSFGWDAACRRICVYGLLEFRNTRHKLLVFDTHLDHMGVIARNNSIRLILDRANALNHEHVPVVIMGDFNLEPVDSALKAMTTGYMDAKAVCTGEISGPAGTFNNFRFDLPVTQRIDYVFISKGKSEVKKYQVIADADNGLYPSDHLPVFVTIKIKQE